MTTRVTRNHGIDVLRGFSILLVILHHTGLRIPLKRTEIGSWLPHRLSEALNYNGYEAVFVFFTISGFLIAHNAMERWGALQRIDVRAFYARRFARIMPCLLLLVAVLSALHLLGFDDYVIHRTGQSLPGAVIAALGLHLNWYEGHTGYLPGGWDVLWSLSIEEIFYIGFPIVCLLTRRAWVLVVMLVLLAISLPFTHAALVDNEIWQEKAYLPGMSAIAVGVLGALIAWQVRQPRRWVRVALCIVGMLGIGGVMLAGREVWQQLRDAYLLALVVSAMCLILAMHWRESARESRNLPGTGWLQSFGRLSYEIYLTHMFVVFAAVRLYKLSGGDIGMGYIWYVPIVLACWLLGWVVARFISIPADRALRARLMKSLPAMGAAEVAATN